MGCASQMKPNLEKSKRETGRHLETVLFAHTMGHEQENVFYRFVDHNGDRQWQIRINFPAFGREQLKSGSPDPKNGVFKGLMEMDCGYGFWVKLAVKFNHVDDDPEKWWVENQKNGNAVVVNADVLIPIFRSIREHQNGWTSLKPNETLKKVLEKIPKVDHWRVTTRRHHSMSELRWMRDVHFMDLVLEHAEHAHGPDNVGLYDR